MKTSDLLAMCVRNLLRRKFRTLLTVVGVVIGTCAIVVMMSLGIGIGKSQEEMLKSYGDLTIINVYFYGSAGDDDVKLDDEAVAAMQALPNVDIATPMMRFEYNSPKLSAGKKDRYVMGWSNLTGVYPGALEKLGYTIKEGEGLSESRDTKKMNIVFGEQTAYDFEDTKRHGNNSYVWADPDEDGNPTNDPFFPPMTTPVKLLLEAQDKDKHQNVEYEGNVVGILKGDWGKGYETMYGTFITINDMKRMKKDYEKANNIKLPNNYKLTYNDVRVKMKDIRDVSTAEQSIRDMGFDTYSREGERQAMEQNSRQIQMILGGLGAISMLVAAISITNTMIMSVYERTREIGVMKVLGCFVGNIRSIFLVEAGLIGFFGGVVGVGVSFVLSYVMNAFGSNMGFLSNMMGGGRYGGMGDSAMQISIIPPWLVLLGMLFATVIGLVSGFSPANRAVKISALEAIKQE